MKTRLPIAALAALAALALPAADGLAQRRPPPPAPRRAAPAAVDWTRNVVRTAEGGTRVGNPNAPVKVIEFFSLACPHCAEFAAESGATFFPRYVRPGRVSIEYRNIVINGPDISAAVLTRCASPRAFIAMSDELLRTQAQWLGRAQTIPEAQRAALRNMSPLQSMQRVVPLLGLDRVGVRHGLTPALQRACLTSQANFDRLEAMQRAANSQFGVTGTPTFVINGRVVDTNVWAGIEPLLRGR